MIDALTLEGWLSRRRPDDPPDCRLQRGEVVDDWRVEAFLGKGLSAEVYRVVGVSSGREGALKLLTDSSRGLGERFRAEADMLRRLPLRPLPRYLGGGELDGTPYYVMEHLHPLPAEMPRAEVSAFMVAVARSVHDLHDAGYIHRDLKPGNIMLRRNGEPVLIDLGLAKRHDAGVIDPVVRHGRSISIIDGRPVGVGTLDFAAPEQLLKAEASVQSDVFSLGKIMLSLYGGRPPRNLRPIIRRATREQPDDRYGSARDFAAAIRHRYRARWALAVLLLAAAAAAAFAWWRQSRVPAPLPPPPAPPRAPAAPSVDQLPDEPDGDYFRRMRELAERGEAAAMFKTGLLLFHGTGCVVDRPSAFRWYLRAAELGNIAAMNDLAYCLINGFGIPANPKEGFAWALRAAEKGHSPSQVMVGECYMSGTGVNIDLQKALAWLRRAAMQGNNRARLLLRSWPVGDSSTGPSR